MSIIVEVMRAIGAIREQGCDPDWTLLPDGVTHAKFRSNSNHHVTPDECLLIAQRLRAGLKNGTRECSGGFTMGSRGRTRYNG